MAYTDRQFLDKFKPYAINDMRETGILASLTAAQAFIESSKGNSGLTQKASNLFGMKGFYNGQAVKMWTTEYYNGVATRVLADFRKYPSWQESVNDHSGLFNRLNRYKNLRGETNYIKACNFVQADGYATSPVYSTTLLTKINQFKLYEWDAEALGTSAEKHDVLPAEEYFPTLLNGSRNDYVLHWQKYLNQSGYFCGTEDGIFGKNTELAVKQWQMAHGLVPDGIIGKKTWAKVYEIDSQIRSA